MGRVFFIIAAILFFLAAVGATILPNATGWGFVALALGLAVGADYWPARRTA